MPNIKFKDKNIARLLNFRNQHVAQELENLIYQKQQYIKLFKIKKPKKFFLNNSRGINNFFNKLCEERKKKKKKVLCFLISHGTLSYQKLLCKII